MELLQRAGWGDLDGVKTLIQQRVRVDTTNRCNQTALYFACENGHAKVAQYLLDHGASVNLGAKPLIVAVRKNKYDCVQLLLKHHAYINCTNTKGQSPMSVALQMHHYSIILLLLQYGAKPPASLGDIAVQLLNGAKVEHAAIVHQLIDKNLIDLTSESIFLAAFSFAFKRGSIELAQRMLSNDTYSQIDKLYTEAAYYSANNNWPNILSKLLEKKVNANATVDGQTLLYAACKEGHETVVTLLLNNGADPNIASTSATSKGYSLPLQIAVYQGNTTICDMLLAKGAKLDQSRESLLHTACSGGADEWKSAGEAVDTRSVEHRLSTIRLLLQQGVDVNVISDAETALYRACASQQLQVVQMLLEAGADVNLTSSQRYPVIAAFSAGNAELIDMLIKSGADVKCRNYSNETCLHAFINGYSLTTASQKRDSTPILDVANIIKSLLECGVDINACYLRNETALYRASKAGYEEIVRLLLEAGAEINGSSSRHPLYAACEQGYTQIVDLLLQHGADSNLSVSSERSGVLSMHMPLSRMLGLGFAEREVSSNSLPICCALQKGYTDIIHLLLKHGADVNKQDSSGKSAFTYFIELITRLKTPQVLNPLEEKDLNLLKSMLSAGGDVNILSKNTGQNALHVASSLGMCDLMTELIQHGADCNQLTSTGKGALDLVCEKGHAAAVELLLNAGAKPDRKRTTTGSSGNVYSSYRSGQSAMPVLCTASKNGSETMVKMLLKHGADANSSDEKGNTALHLATSNTIFETLLNAGANINATNNAGDTALSVLCKERPSDANAVELLLKFGADPNICFPLHNACKNNDTDITRLLLTYGANANVVKERYVSYTTIPRARIASRMPMKGPEPSPLCLACKNGSTAMADYLLKNKANVAFTDSDGNTALHFAVQRLEQQANLEQGDPIVTLLLQHEAPVNVVSNDGETPLYVACVKGRAGIVQQLLELNADVNLTTTRSKKYPLLIACEKKFRDIAMMLLDRAADVEVTKDNQTPLKLAAAAGDVVLVKELLSRGADVNQLQNISNTALHVAAVPRKDTDNKAFADIVHRLLKSCAEPNSLNDKGETPLYLACRSTDAVVNLAIVQTLLEHGAEPNTCPPSSRMSRYMYHGDDHVLPPLISAARCGNNELAILLIKFGARVDHRIESGRTALLHCTIHYADTPERRLEFDKRYTATAETLLSAGADVNATDRTGATPLYFACTRGKDELVKLLLNRGANPNTGAKDKCPIHAASRGQHYDAVKLLLEFKANVSVCDQEGKTALHHALESESYKFNTDKSGVLTVVQLLLDSGADVNAVSEYGVSPFYVACSKGLASVVARMLKCGAKVDGNNDKKLPVNVACEKKHTSVLRLLLTNGANPNMKVEDEYYHGPSLPLHIAAADDSSERVELLLKHGANVNVPDVGGNTALHRAIQYYRPRTTSMLYSHEAVASRNAKSVVDVLLENKADVNIANNDGVTPLYRAASSGLIDVVSKMLQIYGGNPNKASSDKHPLVAACQQRNVKLVEILLKHGADPNLASASCRPDSKCQLPLCIAVEGNCDEIITSLLKADANVNATGRDGKTAVQIATESLTRGNYSYSLESMRKKLSTARLLLQHGADLNPLMPDSPLYSVVTAFKEARRSEDRYKVLAELLQLMVKNGAILLSPSCQPTQDIYRQLLSDGTLRALATFDGKHELIVDLFRAGADFQLLGLFCNAVATSLGEAKSITLCQAAVLAGYTPSAGELQNIQLAAARENATGHVLKQLVSWLNDERQQVPTLFRQCRVAIRRRLSAAVQFRTITPSIDKLPLPSDLKLYLQFDGKFTEIDLSVNSELSNSEPTEETSLENRRYLLYHYRDYVYHYDDYYDRYNSDYYYGSDSDEDRWFW